jgi:hypothetical protein
LIGRAGYRTEGNANGKQDGGNTEKQPAVSNFRLLC